MAESTKTGSDEFGDLLRSARERLGMSRRDLAEATGLSYPYISQIETGYRMPSTPAMRSLADALGLRVDSLFDAIPPTAARESAAQSPPPPGPPPAAPVPPPTARSARHMASPARVAAAGGAPGTAGGSADAAAAGAAGGSPVVAGAWIQNQRFAPSVAGSGMRTDAPPTVDTLFPREAAREPIHDRILDEATALLSSLPAGERLTALGEVQARVVRSVVEDRVRDAGRKE